MRLRKVGEAKGNESDSSKEIHDHDGEYNGHKGGWNTHGCAWQDDTTEATMKGITFGSNHNGEGEEEDDSSGEEPAHGNFTPDDGEILESE